MEASPTVLIQVHALTPDSAVLARLGAALRAGELVAFPTETVYGLGADATNSTAVAGIFAAKGRPSTDPLIVHIADMAMLSQVTGHNFAELPAAARTLAERFWPGPLTLVLPRGAAIPAQVAAGLATVGVRWPGHPVARGLIAAAGVPIAAPSANRFGHTSPTTAHHVFDDLSSRIPWILDAGPCAIGIESTIVDVTGDAPVLLRPGGVPREAIEAALGMALIYHGRLAADGAHATLAPGMLLSHYAPHARLLVFEGSDPARVWAAVLAEVRTQAALGLHVGVLLPADLSDAGRAAGAFAVAELGATAGDLTHVAHQLFAGLRALDATGVDLIISGSFPQTGLGLAIRDRLWRAAGGATITLPEDGIR